MRNRTVRVNLDGRSTLRDAGASGQGEKITNLPGSLTRLVLRLADGSGPGEYSLTIVDAFGATVFTRNSSSRGRILKAVIDTRGIRPGEYRLCVRNKSQEENVPDCFPMMIRSSRTNAGRVR
jgi:hypothetical protein